MALEFIPGKKYVNRKGEVYIFIRIFKNPSSPLLFEREATGWASWRNPDGRYLQDGEDSSDIVAEYVEPDYVWINCYAWSCEGVYHRTKKMAEQNRSQGSFLYTLRLDLKTGETCQDT